MSTSRVCATLVASVLLLVPNPVYPTSIILGHPTGSFAPADEAVRWSALVPLRAITYAACDGRLVEEQRVGTLDWASPVALPLAAGEWCGVGLQLSGPVRLSGVLRDGTAFVVEIAVAAVWFAGPIVVPEGAGSMPALTLAYPGWDWVLPRGAGRVSLGSDTSAARELADALRLDSVVVQP